MVLTLDPFLFLTVREMVLFSQRQAQTLEKEPR